MNRRLKIGILGASGKMGKKLHGLVMDHADYQDTYHLVFAASGPNDPRFALLETTDMDVLIDFSAVASTLAAAKICARKKIPFLI
jgi:dihydrodipicolinate reductase